MDFFQLSAFGAIIGTLSIVLLYIYLYLLYHERYMGMWAISWTAFFSRIVIFDSGLFHFKDSALGYFAYQLLYIICCILFIYSAHLFINKLPNKYWLYSIAVTAVSSAAFSLMQLPAVYKLAPSAWLGCSVLFYTGTTFINIKTRGIGKYITGGAFFLWSILTAATPFMAYNNELVWQVSLFCGILRLFITSGTLMVYFEKTRAELIEHFDTLQQLNRELNNFCHSVSHDLKAPLLLINKLTGCLARGCSDKLDHNEHELIQHIQEKSTEVIKITDHLLELCKMAEMPMKIEIIKLETLFREVYDELIKLQPGRQVEFKIKQLPAINGDTIMIKLLIRNILSNALKFTRNRRQAIIEVDAKEVEDNYVISVKDNGAGFDMRYSSKLFGVFERLHSDNEFEGSGVGLAISQKILKRHNGKAWLTGKVDEGAVFSFRFPKLLPQQHSVSMLVAPDTAVS